MRALALLSVLGISAAVVASCAAGGDEGSTSRDPSDAAVVDAAASVFDAADVGEVCSKKCDCKASTPCTPAACTDGKCVYAPVVCAEATDECSPNECVPNLGVCRAEPRPDGSDCAVGGRECMAGKCTDFPGCFGLDPMQFIHCPTGNRSTTTALYPANRVGSYTCAPGEVAAEVAYEFDPPANANVTVTLAVTGGPDVDLDLIVIEGPTCHRKSPCANPALPGGGRQGVTPGTGTETVTFTTAATEKKYYIVVDGKVTTPAAFNVIVNCN